MNKDRLKLQKQTIEKIKKISKMQNEEIKGIIFKLANDALDVIESRDGSLEEFPDTLMQLMEENDLDGFKRLFTQEEVRVTRNTLNALSIKKILEFDAPYGLDGAEYWKWTGKEL